MLYTTLLLLYLVLICTFHTVLDTTTDSSDLRKAIPHTLENEAPREAGLK